MASHLPVSRLPGPSTFPNPKPGIPRSASGLSSNSNTNLNDALQPNGDGVKIGDRVDVSAGRYGIVQFVGPADFGPGVWVGVELDEPKGRNDGSVNGKRYFKTKPSYGLFAPIEKVTILPPAGIKSTLSTQKIPNSSSSHSIKSGLANSTSLMHPPSKPRTESQESVTSNLSSASKTHHRQIPIAGIPSSKTAFATSTNKPSTHIGIYSGDKRASQADNVVALQKLLKEKEDYIAQLAKERNHQEPLEEAFNNEADSRYLSQQRRDFEQLQEDLSALRQREQALVKEKEEMEMHLLEEKQKVEDLQFQIEERNIDSTTMKHRVDQDESRLFELEEQLNEERAQREVLEKQVAELTAQLKEEQVQAKDAEDCALAQMEEMEVLQNRIVQLEAQLREANDRQKDDSLTKMLQIKENDLKELQQKVQDTEGQLLQKEETLLKLKEEVESMRSQQETDARAHAELMSLVERLKQEEINLKKEVQQATVQEKELRQQLSSAQTKAEQAQESRLRVEQEYEQLVHSSGNTSEEIQTLQKQLKERNDKLSNMQNDLSTMQQELRLGQEELDNEKKTHTETVSQLLEERNLKESGLEASLQEMQNKLQSQQEALDSQKLQQEKQLSDLKQTHTTALENLQKEMEDAKQDLHSVLMSLEASTKELEESKRQFEETKHELTNVKETLNTCEKERGEVIVLKKKTFEEKEALSNELTERQNELLKLRDQLTVVQHGNDSLENEKQSMEKQLEEMRATLKDLQTYNDSLTKEKSELEARVSNLIESQNSLKTTAPPDKEEFSKVAESLKVAQEELSHQKVGLQKLEEEKQSLQAELQTLQKELDDIRLAGGVSDRLASQLENIISQKSELESEIKLRSDELLSAQKLLKENEESLAAAKLEKEQSLEQHHKTVADLESEKKALIKKLEDAEYLLIEAERQQQQHQDVAGTVVSSPNGDTSNKLSPHENDVSATSVQEKARENAEKQITYLNRNIAELQTRNVELQRKIDLLTSGKSEEISKDVLSVNSKQMTEEQLTARMYCDHCEIFDSHETQDCPRPSVDPTCLVVCEICGQTGHSINECPDDETF